MSKKRTKTSKKSKGAVRAEEEARQEADFFGDEPAYPQHFLSLPYPIEELLLKIEDQEQMDGPTVEIEGFHIQFHTHGRRLEMCVTIPEDASAAKIDRAWKTIMKWRNRLTAFQGKQNELMEFLSVQHPRLSYQKIADELNADLQRDLEAAHYDIKENKPGWSGGLVKVRYVLGEMGFSQQDTTDYIANSLDNLQHKKPAFDHGAAPVTRVHVRDRLDTWRQRARRRRRK